jgi:AraC-like DNA-binding protein
MAEGDFPGGIDVAVSGVYSRALLRRFGTTPEATAQLLSGTGFDTAALNAPGAETPLSSLLTIAANITHAHGETWALDAATMWSTAMQGALDIALRSSATIDDALRIAARYARVRAPYLKARLESTAKARRLIFERAVSMEEPLWRAIAYAVGLSVLGSFSQMLDCDMPGVTVEFPWPVPAYASKARAAFQCPVRFAGRHFVVEIPASLGRRMPVFADPALHSRALVELSEAARRLDGADSLARNLERLVANHLPRRLREEEAARQLGLSRRTLSRRMASAGTSFRSVLDSVLRQEASRLLAEGTLSRDAMAAALGYSDPTSFSRACRRWFQMKRSTTA